MRQILEQFLHFIVFGAIAYFSVEVSIAGLAFRELSRIGRGWLPKVIRGQWPPGDPDQLITGHLYPGDGEETRRIVVSHPLTQMDRVEDLRLDLVVSLAGVVGGSVVGRMM